jgi:hypothetical protein
MSKVTRFGLFGMAIVAVLAWASPAAAKCGGSGKSMFTYGSLPTGACGYYCTMNDPGPGVGSIRGDYWVIGQGIDNVPTGNPCLFVGSGNDNGTYEADGTCGQAGWLAGAAPNEYYVLIDTDGGNTDGCPLGGDHVAVAFYDKSTANDQSYFGVMVSTMNAAGRADMGLGGKLTMAPIPKPNVTFSSKAGSTINLNLSVPPLPQTACVDGTGAGHCPGGPGTQVIQGWNVYRFEKPRADATADSNRLRTAWTSVGQIGLAGGPVALTCSSNANNARLALVPRLDSGFQPEFVGVGSSRVECDPTLADPGTKYKIIDKKPTTKGPAKQ